MGCKIIKGLELHRKISENEELIGLEMNGFIEGEKRGKTMDVSLEELARSLEKQYRDWRKAYYNKQLWKDGVYQMKKTLADLINVAGCVFIKIEGGGEVV